MESQTNEIKETDWILTELTEQQNIRPKTELKPALKLDEKKVYEVDIDFSKPWEKWVNPVDGNVKKIIPLKYNNTEMVFFLSVKNPVYREILEFGKKGQTHFKIMRIGQAKATRYSLVN